jgi:hypothetical protein
MGLIIKPNLKAQDGAVVVDVGKSKDYSNKPHNRGGCF